MTSIIKEKLSKYLIESKTTLGDQEIRISREDLLDTFKLLKFDPELSFNLLLSLTVVDYLDHDFMARGEEGRFEVVYHLLSLRNNERLRVKVSVPEDNPEVESITSLWSGADFMEREAWDMFGVVFKGHPNLERILMYEEFKGYPLRKDYPVQGKQPRIPLLHPEVRNTAVDMVRPELVQIGKGV